MVFSSINCKLVGLVLFVGSLLSITACADRNRLAQSSQQDHPDALYYPSANQNHRVRFVILHYTAGNWQQSLQALTQPSQRPVSSHYLIPESQDPSYPTGQPFKVYQLVPEQQRAWHAGHSKWQDRQHLNDQSIGIELVNQAYCEGISVPQTSAPEPELCITPDFDPAQMLLLADLLQGILQRYPDITPDRVLAHSDVAPDQKQDPGPRFPWQWLASRGIGAWYEPAQLKLYWRQPVLDAARISQWQQALKSYGYGIGVTGTFDPQSRLHLLAFQRHFVPEQIDGLPNRKTLAVLTALLAKYRASALQQLQATVTTVEIKPLKQ